MLKCNIFRTVKLSGVFWLFLKSITITIIKQQSVFLQGTCVLKQLLHSAKQLTTRFKEIIFKCKNTQQLHCFGKRLFGFQLVKNGRTTTTAKTKISKIGFKTTSKSTLCEKLENCLHSKQSNTF